MVKDKINDNKTSVSDNSYKIDLVESRIESAQEHSDQIRDLKEAEVTKIKEKMSEHISNIETEKEHIEGIEGEITSLIETIQDKANVKGKDREGQGR